MIRLRATIVLAVALSATAWTGPAAAQDYPARPIRVVVGFTAGGTTDLMARLLAERMRASLGQPVVVENKPGANGSLGADFVAKAEPDGYTLYFTTAGVATVYPHLARTPYDAVADFAPVALVAFQSTMLVVNATMPVNSAVELATLARANPGKITIAITALGSVSHLGLVLYQSAAGVQFQQVPYRGAAHAMTDLIGGTLNGLLGDVPTVLANVRAGKIKPLAATSKHRSDIFPDVPTFVEQGFADTVADQWAGVLAPAKTPPAAIAKLNGAIVAGMSDPGLRGKLKEIGVTPSPSTAEEFGTYLREEYARWGRVVREKNIKGE
jgi:tripartite-type tricarboxylate transporter receptor subunit TctC